MQHQNLLGTHKEIWVTNDLRPDSVIAFLPNRLDTKTKTTEKKNRNNNYIVYPILSDFLWFFIKSAIGYLLLLLSNQVKKHCLITIKAPYHIF